MEVAGKVAVVTGGGGGGAGGAIARRLARDGASVVVVDLDQEAASGVVRTITEEGGGAVLFAGDVKRSATVNVLMDFLDAQYGGVDVIVNNASDDPGGRGPFEHWSRSVETDLLAPMLLSRVGIERMRQRGGGAIVNIASLSALPHGEGHSAWPAYDVAKAGVLRFTTALDWLQSEGIRVNCVVPGWIASPAVTEYVDSLTPGQRQERGVPEQLLQPDEVAAAVERLIVDDLLAGRVLLLRNDQPPALIALDDPGYAALEPLSDELALL